MRPDLPGEWSTRGGGMKAILVREPIGWAIPWIGCSKASSVRTHAGVAPALWDRLDWLMGIYGLDMADVPRGPRSIELGTDGDVDVARGFVGHAHRALRGADGAALCRAGRALPATGRRARATEELRL